MAADYSNAAGIIERHECAASQGVAVGTGTGADRRVRSRTVRQHDERTLLFELAGDDGPRTLLLSVLEEYPALRRGYAGRSSTRRRLAVEGTSPRR